MSAAYQYSSATGGDFSLDGRDEPRQDSQESVVATRSQREEVATVIRRNLPRRVARTFVTVIRRNLPRRLAWTFVTVLVVSFATSASGEVTAPPGPASVAGPGALDLDGTQSLWQQPQRPSTGTSAP